MTTLVGKGDVFEADILKLIFQAVAIANIADNAASAPLTNLYIALHTSTPTEEGDQTTGEIAYTGYARVAVARTSGGFTITGSSISPAANVDFGQMTAGAGGTAAFWTVGTAGSGAGKVLYGGAISPSIAVANGSIPRLTPASTVTES